MKLIVDAPAHLAVHHSRTAVCRRARRLWLSRMCCPPAVVIFGPFMFGASANIFLNLCPLCRLLRSTWMVVANTLLSSRHAWSLLGFVHLTIQMEQKRAYGESRPRTTRSANYPTNLPSHGSESARIRRSAACRMCTVGLPDCRSFMCVLSVHVYSVLYGVDDWYSPLLMKPRKDILPQTPSLAGRNWANFIVGLIYLEISMTAPRGATA